MNVASNDIADAIVAAMVSLNFANTDIVKRKKPTLPAKLTPGRKAIVVSVGEEGKQTKASALKTLTAYPAAVTIISEGGTNTGDDETIRAMRATIRLKLQDYGIYASVTGFNDVDLSGGPPFNSAALDATLNYSIQTATVEVLEGRQ